MKDPALLWYFNDWAGGTIAMSRHLKGCYMDVLVAQFNLGDLSLDQIKTILGSDFGSSWPALQKKFTLDQETGFYYNERLKLEREKRSSFTASRRINGSSKAYAPATDKHMEDRNENRNVISIKKEYGELLQVKLSDEEYTKLVDRFGEKNTVILIDELDNYIASKGKKYASHYATILTWARRKIVEHADKQSTKKMGTV